jgi:hypothetical protein
MVLNNSQLFSKLVFLTNKLKYEILIILVPASLIKKQQQNYGISIISGDIAMGKY